MSGSVLPTQVSPQIQVPTLGPGIQGLVDLFIQGIETGLVFAQFSQWFYERGRSESYLVSIIVVFVTLVGLAQSGVCLASTWSKYVRQPGMFSTSDWLDYLQLIPTMAISVPVQALIIRRCYYIVGKKLFIITPLVLLLVASVVMAVWVIVSTIHYVTTIKAMDPVPSLQGVGIFWPYMVSVLFPSLLDLILTGILLHYLTRTMRRVYAAHERKRIFRIVKILWQSALPPTLCAICQCVLYVRFSTARDTRLQGWMMVVQSMVGKLYVLSLLYMINGRPPKPDEISTTFISTLSVSAEDVFTCTRDARGVDIASCDLQIIAARGPTRTVDLDFAV